MIFKCSPNLKIFSNDAWFDYNDLSIAVGYWANILKEKWGHSDIPIGVVATGDTSFSTTSFFLALYETKTNYVYLPNYYDYTEPNFCEKYELPEIQQLVILGSEYNTKIKAITPLTFRTADFVHSFRMFETPHYSPLEFEFSDQHKITTLTSGSTGKSRVIITTAASEARSISAAIAEYFDPDDVCLFSHGLSHRGVHTTSILPALFFVDTIYFAETYTWSLIVDKATHCQWFATMRQWCNLTPNLKKITFGGSILSDSTADYIFSCSPDVIVYDIYGLTECLPPVAIRKLTKDSRPETFTLCRDELSIRSSDNNILVFNNDIDGTTVYTGDIALPVSDKEFKFLGRDKKEVRVEGNLINQSIIIARLENDFDSKSFSAAVKNGVLCIQVTTEDNKIAFTNWCGVNFVEDFTVEVVDNIITSGGIKTINQ